MHWRIKKLKYDILIPQLGKSIYRLNPQEADDYFHWFMDKVPERVDYVSCVCAKELKISKDRMDCSPESLLLLWKWFRRRAKTEPIVRTAEQEKNKSFPDSIWMDKRQLTLETEYILRDIGMYLGETFRKNNASLYWTYYTKPRRDFFVNQPLLKGFIDRTFDTPFEASFEPIHMAGVQAAKILSRESKDDDLLKIYNIWIKKI